MNSLSSISILLKLRRTCQSVAQHLNIRHSRVTHVNLEDQRLEAVEGDKPPSRQSGKKIQAMCLNDRSLAPEIARALQPHLSSGSTHECFPGNCFLTEALLQQNLPVSVWEPRLVYKEAMQDLRKKSAFHMNTKSLLNRRLFLPFVANLESGDRHNLVVPYSSQFHSFLYCILANAGNLSGMSNLTMFLWMPQSDFKDFMRDPNEQVLQQKGVSLLSLCLPVTFESQLLLKLPLGAFSNMTLKKAHDDQLYLIKTRILDWSYGHSDGKRLLEFLKIVHLHRSKRLIPELEQLCPGIGLDLINMGYTTRSMMKQITPKDIFRVYEIICQSTSSELDTHRVASASQIITEEPPDDYDD